MTSPPLAALCELIIDCEHKTAPPDTRGEYPLIRTPDIGLGFLKIDQAQRVTEDTYREWTKRAIPRAGDLILAREAPVGNVGLVPQGVSPVLGQRTVLIRTRPEVLDSRYLNYLLSGPEMRGWMNGVSIGSTVPHLNMADIRSMSLPPLPPVRVQRKIAAILSAYDELIDNNRRRIKLLDEIAQCLYREWFVELRYPGHLQTRVVDSELGSIPVGWKVVPLGDELEVIEAGSRPRGGIDPSEAGVPSVGAENVLGLGHYDYSKEKYISIAFFESMRRGRVMDGDVLLYKDGAYIGRTSFFGNGFPHSVCAINEHVFRLRAKRLPQTFLYYWLSSPETTRRVRALNANAAQPGLNQASMKGLEIIVPSDEIVDTYARLVNPLVSATLNRALASRKLQLARDLLLPRLISGEIDVDELDIETGRVAA